MDGTIRGSVVYILAHDDVLLATAEGGVLDKPLVGPGEQGFEESAWIMDRTNPMAGFPKPLATVTDVRENPTPGVEQIAAVDGFFSVVAYGPRTPAGRTAARTILERAYELLAWRSFPITKEGRGIAEIEWRGSLEIIDSPVFDRAVEGEMRFFASYVKREMD